MADEMKKKFRVTVFVELEANNGSLVRPSVDHANELVRTALQVIQDEGYEDPDVAFPDFEVGSVEEVE